jgi:hypothetical protein
MLLRKIKMTQKTNDSSTWTVYAQEKQRKEIVKLCDKLHRLIEKDSKVSNISVPRAELVTIGLRAAIESYQ